MNDADKAQYVQMADADKIRYEKEKDYLASVAICNVPTSSLARESDFVLFTNAGPEIGVASTKAFTTQLAALMLLSLSLAKRQALRLLSRPQLPPSVTIIFR